MFHKNLNFNLKKKSNQNFISIGNLLIYGNKYNYFLYLWYNRINKKIIKKFNIIIIGKDSKFSIGNVIT